MKFNSFFTTLNESEETEVKDKGSIKQEDLVKASERYIEEDGARRTEARLMIDTKNNKGWISIGGGLPEELSSMANVESKIEQLKSGNFDLKIKRI